MDATTVYAISIGSVVLLWILLTIGLQTLLQLYRSCVFYFSKSNCQLRLLRGDASVTSADLLVFCVYIASNITAIFIEGSSIKSIEKRAGYLALINLIPLGLVGRPNVLTDICGISHRRQEQLHAAMGCMAMVHAVTHSGIALYRKERSVPGYIASAGIIHLCVFMQRFFHRVAFEGALSLHRVVAITVVASLVPHVARGGSYSLPQLYLALGTSCWVVVLIARAVYITYRSVGACGYILGYEGDEEIVLLVVDLRKPWHPGPGQFAYITIPGISQTATFQSHPFQLAWWDRSLGRAFFLVSPHKGFTRHLLHNRSSRMNKSMADNFEDCMRAATRTRTIIEGPYSQFEDLSSYGTILMIATGLGITSQIPYIKYLIEGHESREVRTQKIWLFWQVRKEHHRHWVSRWMAELMQADQHRILAIYIYITDSDPPTKRNDTPGQHDALKVYWEGANFRKLVEQKIQGQKGGIAVTVCADKKTKNEIRKEFEQQFRKGIVLIEFDFEPSS